LKKSYFGGGVFGGWSFLNVPDCRKFLASNCGPESGERMGKESKSA